MNQNQQEWIVMLENAWAEPDGFLFKVRQGKYVHDEGQAFIAKLSEIKLQTYETISKRLVSLMWYIPGFLEWQEARVAENGGDVADFERLSTQALNLIEESLGVP